MEYLYDGREQDVAMLVWLFPDLFSAVLGYAEKGEKLFKQVINIES